MERKDNENTEEMINFTWETVKMTTICMTGVPDGEGQWGGSNIWGGKRK